MLIKAKTQNIHYLSNVATQRKARQRCVRCVLIMVNARKSACEWWIRYVGLQARINDGKDAYTPVCARCSISRLGLYKFKKKEFRIYLKRSFHIEMYSIYLRCALFLGFGFFGLTIIYLS